MVALRGGGTLLAHLRLSQYISVQTGPQSSARQGIAKSRIWAQEAGIWQSPWSKTNCKLICALVYQGDLKGLQPGEWVLAFGYLREAARR